jgi:hypothetical protein
VVGATALAHADDPAQEESPAVADPMAVTATFAALALPDLDEPRGDSPAAEYAGDVAAPEASPVARLPIPTMIPEPPAAPAPAVASKLLVVPEVRAFRPKRTASAAGHVAADTAGHDPDGPAGTDSPDSGDTVQTPAPGLAPDSHDRRPPAPGGDAGSRSATKVSGPAAVTDTAV